jgi:N-terminal domain of anti-restriction factor ArdC
MRILLRNSRIVQGILRRLRPRERVERCSLAACEPESNASECCPLHLLRFPAHSPPPTLRWLRFSLPLRFLRVDAAFNCSGSDGRFRPRRFRAKQNPNAFGTHRAFTHALPPYLRSVLSLSPFRLFLSAIAAGEEQKQAGNGGREQKMKFEEINNRTKDAVNHLVAALESGQSEVLTQFLAAMARFHNYSFGNIMLIARQKPQATNVAGIRTWNSLGRFVKRGEKGILILAPMIGRRKAENAPEATEDAKESQAQLYGFRAVYVFDISQTEGKELPTLTGVQGDVSGYRDRLVKFVEFQSITLSYSDKIAPAKGLSHGGKITLLSGMQPAEEFSTLAHEIAHEMLHRGDRRTLTTKQVRETEAEAVAFVVCQSIGLQTGSSSADYIQLWNGDAELLRESLEAVQQSAAVILGGIAPEEINSH